jgi:hypothetical protein
MPSPLLDRLERLARLHNVLAEDRAQGGHGLPVGILLEEMRCERKPLYRLVEELRELDAPIQYVDDLHVWRYGHTWNFPVRFVWTVDGAVGMRLSMDCLLDPNLARGLQGIVAIDPDLNSGKATLPRLTGRFSPDLLGPLARAIKERRRMEFAYRKPREKKAHRRLIEPLEIFEWNGMPYLQGREVGDEAISFKRFALSRLVDLEVSETRFKLPSRTAVPSCLGAFCGTPFTAEIEADPEHAPYVRERQWHPKQKISSMSDGSVRFTLPFGDHEEAARWLLGQGPGFRPVSPAPFVKAWKSAIAALHRSANRSV